MKLEMARNSIFATLLRSPWWMSVIVAAGVAVVARLLLPEAYMWYGVSGALPFLGIAIASAWQQRHAPSAARVIDTLAAVRAMPWSDFSSAIEDAFRREGYVVRRLDGVQADFEISAGSRTSLVSCKRWKVARAGIEPLRALHAAKGARDMPDWIYVAAGEITDNARKFAGEQKIRLIEGAELARLMGRNPNLLSQQVSDRTFP